MRAATVLRGLGAAAVVVVTVGLTTEVTSQAPQPEAYQLPFPVRGHVGEPVRARDVELTVIDVSGGRAVVDAGGSERTSAGLWVVAQVRVEAVDEPMTPGVFRLSADGATFDQTARVESPFSNVQQPGVPVTGSVAFEVPLDQRGDVRVRMSRHRSDVRADAEADIEVVVDDATWAAWAGTAAVDIAPPELGG